MDTESRYNAALDYLYSFVDYSLKHSSELAKADFNLDRMFVLLAELGDPQKDYPIIHVAGTKGKGSVCALCASALSAAGHRTGRYTSPHLVDFTERICLDGDPIPHADVAGLVDELKPAVARVPYLTTFEITTALAFLYFARRGAAAAVIEVGLGGRLDATNVVTPRVSVITSISYDHMAVLGDTLTKIASEKAGIIKPGIPVVSAPQTDEAWAVLERIAAGRGCPLTLVGRDVTFAPGEHSLDGQSLTLEDRRSPAFSGPSSVVRGPSFTIPLLGPHQIENAATAYAALRTSGLAIGDAAIRDGFARVRWPGRFEVARREPPVIFDAAHNQDSFARLRQALDDYFPGLPVTLIFGASEDKNIPGMFAEMKPRIARLIITRAAHPRALEPGQVIPLAEAAGLTYEVEASVPAALERALALSEKDGSIVLSAGSIFVTAGAREAWASRPGPPAKP